MLDLDFLGGAVVKNFPAKAGDIRNMGSIPGSRRPPGEGNGNPLQYSRLENSMHRGPWRTTIHGVAESDTTEQLSVRARYLIYSIILASGIQHNESIFFIGYLLHLKLLQNNGCISLCCDIHSCWLFILYIALCTF